MTQSKFTISRRIILDTCIWQHLSQLDLFPQIIKVLQDALSQGYGIAISQFSFFELMHTANVETETKRLEKTVGIKQLHVTAEILRAAARLGSLYKEDGLGDKSPEIGDKIIAATTIVTQNLIYTSDALGYPRPYFNEIGKHRMDYKKNGKDMSIVAYLLEPDNDAINGRFNYWSKSVIGTKIAPTNTIVED